MKKNQGFTLVEAIIVMTSLTMVTVLIWNILNSASQDSYTLTDKVDVQSSVTSLMNMVQQDIQEAKIYQVNSGGKGIINDSVEDIYVFYNNLTYQFDEDERMVTRTYNGETVEYNDIVSFSISTVNAERFGAKVSIVGGKKRFGEEVDKSRYSLNSTFYTRNTI